MSDSPVRLDMLIELVNHRHRGNPLDRVAAACQTAAELEAVADELVGHFVGEARSAGLSWTRIGDHLGVTKQAARKRFTPRISGEQSDIPPEEIVGRFSDEARQAVVRAQEIARAHRLRVIGPEHLLLGVCADRAGIASRALAAAGVDVDELQRSVTDALPTGARRAVRGHLPLSPAALQALILADAERARVGAEQTGGEHLLLALLAANGDCVVEPLHAAAITTDRFRDEITRLTQD